MNKFLSLALLFFFIVSAQAQPPLKNSISPSGRVKTNKIQPAGNETSDRATLPGIPCSPGNFWAINSLGNGSIDELNLSGATVSLVASGIFTATEGNLAYCNNLNGGSFTPTFYTTTNSRIPGYYNGTAWVNTSANAAPDKIFNCGGNGNYLYYILYDSTSTSRGVVRFNGTSLSPVWSWGPGRRSSVGDLAVDQAGNVWFFTGPTGSGAVISDSLYVVTPGGQLLMQYAANLNTTACYGMMLLNSTLYLAFGPAHPQTPNALLPLVLNTGTVSAGVAIPMPSSSTGYADLESCNPGSPLALAEGGKVVDLMLYPNPVTTTLTVYLPPTLTAEAVLSIQDAQGRIVYEQRRLKGKETGRHEINCSHFAPGNYMVSIHSGNGIFNAKMMKL